MTELTKISGKVTKTLISETFKENLRKKLRKTSEKVTKRLEDRFRKLTYENLMKIIGTLRFRTYD